MKQIYAVLQRSPTASKKYRMLFQRKDQILDYTDFGQQGYSDFLQHQDEKRRQRFLKRFQKLIHEKQNDPSSAMTLSHLILWNKPTLESSFKDYLNKFGMKGSIDIS